MSWYSKALDSTKKYGDKVNQGYSYAAGHSAGRHWGYSVGGGGVLGAGLGAGAYGYYSDGGGGAGIGGADIGGLAGASLGAAGGAAFKYHANHLARDALGMKALGNMKANFTQDFSSYM